MSNQALSFIGRMDRREESMVLSEIQEQTFVQRLLGNRGYRLVNKLYGSKRVRDVYVPPRMVDGSAVVMPIDPSNNLKKALNVVRTTTKSMPALQGKFDKNVLGKHKGSRAARRARRRAGRRRLVERQASRSGARDAAE